MIQSISFASAAPYAAPRALAPKAFQPVAPATPPSATPLFGASKKDKTFREKAVKLFLDHYFPDRKRDVLKIYDGDTVTLSGLDKSVRLFGIDAPEMAQRTGEDARAHLEKLIGGTKVRLLSPQKNGRISTDRYGRPIGILESKRRVGFNPFKKPFNVNLQMVKDGYARAYESEALTTDEFRQAETEARKAKRGLWAKGTFSPKAYRDGKR